MQIDENSEISSPCIFSGNKIYSLDQDDALFESSYRKAVCDDIKIESDDAKHNHIT